MSELWAPVEGLTSTVISERGRVVGLLEIELVIVRSVISVALSKSECTVRKAICNVPYCFPVKGFLMRLVLLLGVLLIRLKSRSVYDLFYCLALVNVVYFCNSTCCSLLRYFVLLC